MRLIWSTIQQTGAEKREANRKLALAKQELENLSRDGMKTATTAIEVYDRLNRLLNHVIKDQSSLQYIMLNNIVEAIPRVDYGTN